MALIVQGLSGAIYGTLAVAVLLAAETAEGHSYVTTLEAAAVTLIVYWLAHGYARSLAARLTSSATPGTDGLLRGLGQEVGILLGGSIPLLALVFCWLARLELGQALDVAVWTAAVSLVVVELAAGLRRRSRLGRLLLDGALSLALGGLVLLIRVLLH